MKLLVVLLLCIAVTSSYAQWRRIPGGINHVSISVNYIWGVNSRHQIFRCPRPCTGRWTHVPGSLMQIDVGDEEVWGVNRHHQIFKRPADGSGHWQCLSGSMKHVSASGNGYIWSVDRHNYIYKCKKPCFGHWVRTNGRLKQVDAGHDYVYGVSTGNAIYARPVNGIGSWRRIPGPPGNMKHITGSGRNDVFGITTRNQIYRCKKPCIGEWELMSGRLNQCDATFDSVVGVYGNGVYHRKTGI